MKNLLLLLALSLLPILSTGCGLFPTGKTYDGSEQAYERHPEWTAHTPTYMTGDDEDTDDK
jgi:hypothetical protein